MNDGWKSSRQQTGLWWNSVCNSTELLETVVGLLLGRGAIDFIKAACGAHYRMMPASWEVNKKSIWNYITVLTRRGSDSETMNHCQQPKGWWWGRNCFPYKKKVQWKQNVKSEWNQGLITVSVQQGKKLHRITCTIIIWKWVEWNLCYLSWCSLWAYLHKSLTVFQNRDSRKKQNIPVFNFKVNLTTFAKTFKNLLAY